MKSKTIATAVLSVFVLASVVVLAMKELKKSAGPAKTVSTSGASVVVYYFHGKVRCPTCNSIESYAQEAVQSGFSAQLDDGRLQWRVVNYEESGNEHFATDYKLFAPCVVLVTMHGGKQAQWRSLPEVWEHVGDKPKFIEFVKKNVKEVLDKAALPKGASTT